MMTPTPPKSEENIADNIDKWEDQVRMLEEINREYALNDVFKRTALRSLMVGKAKDHFEMLEAENKTFAEILGRCKRLRGEKEVGSEQPQRRE